MKKWAEIGRDLGYSGKIMSSLSTSLKNSYDRWLNPYETYLRQAKPGVYQQLEYEYGGPLTPSPAPSPMKRSNVNTPLSMRADSPARHATDALQASIGPKQEGDRDTAMADIPAPTSGGFTAINSSGFTAVNSGFTSIHKAASADARTFTPPQRPIESTSSSAKNTPDLRPSGPSALKRQLSTDSLDINKQDGTEQEEAEGGSRRSKRLKKGRFAEDDTFVAAE
jgi:[histone H3]-trimethyl-L-lysine4 demethylase